MTDQGGVCNFGEVFTTDGRILALDLAVLEDDRQFFPLYNVAAVFRQDSSAATPRSAASSSGSAARSPLGPCSS